MGVDRGDGADVAEMAIRINAQFYYDCLGPEELKNIAYNALGALCCNLVGWMRWDHTP